MSWDSTYGWNEVSPDADITSETVLVSNDDPNRRVIVRRIRGTVADALSVRTKNGDSTGTEIASIPAATNMDIPGLQLRTNPGDSLSCIATDTSSNLTFQWAYEQKLTPRVK